MLAAVSKSIGIGVLSVNDSRRTRTANIGQHGTWIAQSDHDHVHRAASFITET
jgi:hypothetical protein